MATSRGAWRPQEVVWRPQGAHGVLMGALHPTVSSGIRQCCRGIRRLFRVFDRDAGVFRQRCRVRNSITSPRIRRRIARVVVRSPGVVVRSPGVVVRSPGVVVRSPGKITLKRDTLHSGHPTVSPGMRQCRRACDSVAGHATVLPGIRQCCRACDSGPELSDVGSGRTVGLRGIP
jgi:hypothetical protein